MEEKNLFEIFSRYNATKEGDVDVIKSRNGNRPDIKYLKWMRGWIEVLKVDPKATYDLCIDPVTGSILHHVGTGGMVHVQVTICGHTKGEWYPIESSPMQSVLWDNITPSQVNKAIKRGMVKCLAHFGLASNLYLNDELTESERQDIRDLIKESKTVDELLTVYESNKELINDDARIVRMFSARKKELQKAE